MDKGALIQYCEISEEIKDIRRRKEDLHKELGKLEFNPYKEIKIPEEGNYTSLTDGRRNAAIHRYRELIERKETELLDLICQAEAQIESIKKSELRTMFRLHYIDGLPWIKVARAMNLMFPERKIKFTEDSCKKRKLRFFENVSQCPGEMK